MRSRQEIPVTFKQIDAATLQAWIVFHLSLGVGIVNLIILVKLLSK